MIGWLQPWALWGLGLVALPVAIHLLQRRHAPRVLFPNTRFVRPSHTASVRLRPPSDLVLLVVRMAVVALAVLAAAQPVWLSPSRVEAWNGRTARAIVVDTSDSMRAQRSDGTTPADAAEAEARAEASAQFAHRIDHDDLREAFRRAAAWLERTPPARREIVVVSDFQLEVLGAASIRALDSQVGLRFVPIRGSREPGTIDGGPLLQARNVSRPMQRIDLTAQGTQLRLVEGPDQPAGGFRVLGSGSEAAAQPLLATLAAAGTPAPDPDQPIAMLFPPATLRGSVGSRFEHWMIATLAGIEQDPELVSLARDVEADALADTDARMILLKDRRGRPLVRAAALDRELVLEVAAPPSSYLAAAVARAALVARYGPTARPEHEIMTISDSTLSSWTRQPGPVGESAWRNADRSDARWLWAGALLLLAAEQLLRSRTAAGQEESRVAA